MRLSTSKRYVRLAFVGIVVAMISLTIAACGPSDDGCYVDWTVEDSGIVSQAEPGWGIRSDRANKKCNAFWVLEFGWVDEELAKNPNAPCPAGVYDEDKNRWAVESAAIDILFHAMFGSYKLPAAEKESYFDDGATKYKWRMELEDNAKGEPTDYTFYKLSLNHRGKASEVWATGQIKYLRYSSLVEY